jgi:hypothetical protein
MIDTPVAWIIEIGDQPHVQLARVRWRGPFYQKGTVQLCWDFRDVRRLRTGLRLS